jgi:hypothetical protein
MHSGATKTGIPTESLRQADQVYGSGGICEPPIGETTPSKSRKAAGRRSLPAVSRATVAIPDRPEPSPSRTARAQGRVPPATLH